MAIKTALWGLSSAVALLGFAGSPALAGHVTASVPSCSGIGNCDSGVDFLASPPGHSGPMTIQSRTPYDYFDSIHFQHSPHVSITRVHSLLPSVALSDAPSGFTGGCHPESTTYCRSSGLSAAPQVASPSVTPAPVAPLPVPHTQIATPPIVSAPPLVRERIVATGGGYDPSKFIPRVYGDPYTITPGIAHVPTSIVDRDPYRAQQMLDSGRAVYNPWTPGGVTPAFAGVPVNTTPVPAPLPPHYAPRGGHVSGYASSYTGHYSGGYVASPPPVRMPAPTYHYGSASYGGSTTVIQGRYGSQGGHGVTCKVKTHSPSQPAPVSPCAKAAAKSRY